MDFTERLKLLIDTKYEGKIFLFASATGFSESNIRSYLKGVMPKLEFLTSVATNCKISSRWLLTGMGDMDSDDAQPSQPSTSVADSSFAVIGSNNKVKHNGTPSIEQVTMEKNILAEGYPKIVASLLEQVNMLMEHVNLLNEELNKLKKKTEQ